MLIRQTLLYLPAQLLGPLFQFIAAVVWTHWLAPDAYGVLTFIIASQELAVAVCLSWWSHYTMRYLGTFADDAARRKYQQSENAVLLGAALLQSGIAFGILLALGQPVTPMMMAVTVVFMVTRSTTAHLIERARARGRIAVYTVGQSIGPVIGFGLAWLMVSKISATPEGALAGFALAQAGGLVWLWRAMGLGLALAVPERAILKRAMMYGLPLIGAGVVGWISLNGIRVIVEHFRGVEAVGLISVGWGLGQRLASVVAMLVTAAAFPLAVQRFQSGARDDGLKQLSDSGALLLALLAPSSAGILMLTPEAVDLMIAEPFRAVTMAVLPLAAIAGTGRNMRVHFGVQVFLLFEQPRLMVLINIVEATALVILSSLGLYFYGFAGATAGCLAGSAIGAVFGFALARIKFGFRFPFAHAGRILLATLCMALVLALPQWQPLVPGELARMVAKIAAGAAVYAGALAMLYPRFVSLALEQLRRRAKRAGAGKPAH